MELDPNAGQDIDAQLLDELLEFFRQATEKDARTRVGKPLPMEGEEAPPMEEAAPAEDPEIPGVEAAPPEGEAGAQPGAQPDMAKLKAALAAMKARGG
jgi:hypothetical protein